MKYPSGTAANRNLAICDACFTLGDPQVNRFCGFCQKPIHLRKPQSIQKTLAFLATAVLLYIPANVLPIMTTTTMGRPLESTIAGGVVTLWHHGSYPIAIVIFVASILIPMLKMMALGWLCWFASRPQLTNHAELTKIYHLTELVGKWSMVDVFVVALLVALVQVGSIMSIEPGPAALAFASVVVFTMLSAKSFDPRLIWDKEM